jgi:transposase
MAFDRYPDGNHLAAAAGIAPVRKQSVKVSFHRRARGSDKALKRVFYQSAFIAVGCDPTSKAYYARKRSQGKNHQQAVLALARRRVNVLHAIMRTRQPYDHRTPPCHAH